MTASMLRPSVWCLLMLAQGLIPNDGPYRLTGNSGLSYVGTAHVYDAASNHLYSSTRGGVYQLDTTSMKVVGRTPQVRGAGSLSFDASRNELYVLALHDDTMNVVDVTTHTVTRTFAAPAWFNVFYEESRGELYYLRGDTHEVMIADRITGRTIATLKLDGRPSFLEGDPARHRVLVRLADKGAIQVIGTTEHSVIATWPARADGESAMAIGRDGSRVFVSAGRDVAMLDGATGTELGRFSTGDVTHSIVYDPATQLVAALSGAGRVNVARVDGTSVTLLQSLDTRAMMNELFLDPKSHKIFGVTRLYDDGVMRDYVSQSLPSDSGSTLLTLTLRK